MNAIARTLSAARQGEDRLAKAFDAVAERHRDEHEIRHIAMNLAGWSRDHVEGLTTVAGAYGLRLDAAPDSSPGSTSALREPGHDGPELRAKAGWLLLADLRDLYLAASENSLYWEMLAQAGQATRDDRLVGLAARSHPQTLRQLRWTNTMIKTLSPQVLTSPIPR